MQIVDGLAMSDAEGNVLTEIVPVSDGLEQGPVVVTVKLNVPVADGDPEIVTTRHYIHRLHQLAILLH